VRPPDASANARDRRRGPDQTAARTAGTQSPGLQESRRCGGAIWTEENFGCVAPISCSGSFAAARSQRLVRSGSLLAVKTDGAVVLFRDGGTGAEILARMQPLDAPPL